MANEKNKMDPNKLDSMAESDPFFADFPSDDGLDGSNNKPLPGKTILKEMALNSAKGVFTGFGNEVSRSMPKTTRLAGEVSNAYDAASEIASTLDQEVRETAKSAKGALSKALPLTKRLLPASVYSKLENALKSDDYEYRQKSEEESNSEQIAGAMSDIFKAQVQAQAQDRQITQAGNLVNQAILKKQHESNIHALSSIDEKLFYQNGFIQSTQTAWMKKMLELKYQHLFVARKTLATTDAMARALDIHLTKITTNTSIPDSQKLQVLKHKEGSILGKGLSKWSDKAENYISQSVNNLKSRAVGKIKDVFSQIRGLTDMAGMGADAATSMPGGAPQAHGMVGSLIGSIYGTQLGRMFMDKVMPMANRIENAAGHMNTQAIFKAKRLKDWLQSGALPGGVGEMIAGFIPDHHDDLQVENSLLKRGGEQAIFDNATRQSIVEIIPAHLSRMTKYLKDIATGKDNEEEVYNVVTRDFATASATKKSITDRAFGDAASRSKNLVAAVGQIKNTFIRKNGANGEADFAAIRGDIARFVANLAFNKEELKVDEIRDYANGVTETSRWINLAFAGLEHPKETARALTSALWNGNELDVASYNYIQDTIMNAMKEEAFKDVLPQMMETFGYRRFFKDDMEQDGTIKKEFLVKNALNIKDERWDSEMKRSSDYFDIVRNTRQIQEDEFRQNTAGLRNDQDFSNIIGALQGKLGPGQLSYILDILRADGQSGGHSTYNPSGHQPPPPAGAPGSGPSGGGSGGGGMYGPAMPSASQDPLFAARAVGSQVGTALFNPNDPNNQRLAGAASNLFNRAGAAVNGQINPQQAAGMYGPPMPTVQQSVAQKYAAAQKRAQQALANAKANLNAKKDNFKAAYDHAMAGGKIKDGVTEYGIPVEAWDKLSDSEKQKAILAHEAENGAEKIKASYADVKSSIVGSAGSDTTSAKVEEKQAEALEEHVGILKRIGNFFKSSDQIDKKNTKGAGFFGSSGAVEDENGKIHGKSFHENFVSYMEYRASQDALLLDAVMNSGFGIRGMAGKLLRGGMGALKGITGTGKFVLQQYSKMYAAAAKGVGAAAGGAARGIGALGKGAMNLGAAALPFLGQVGSAGLGAFGNIYSAMFKGAGNVLSGSLAGAGAAAGGFARGVGALFGRKEEDFVDVFRKDQPINPGDPLASAKDLKDHACTAKGAKLKSSYDITEPLFYRRTMTTMITQKDLEAGLVDIHGKPLKRLRLGGLGAMVGGIAKGVGSIGKGLLTLAGKGLGLYGDVAKGAMSLFGGMFKGAGAMVGNLFGKGKLIVERLDTIIKILRERMPGGKVDGDGNGDGIRDGSYQDQLRKMGNASNGKLRKMGTSGAAAAAGAAATAEDGEDKRSLLEKAANVAQIGETAAGAAKTAGRYAKIAKAGKLGSLGRMGKLGQGVWNIGSKVLPFMGTAGVAAAEGTAVAAGGAALTGAAATGTAAAAGGVAAAGGGAAAAGAGGAAAATGVLPAIPVAGWIALGVLAVGAAGYGIFKACSNTEGWETLAKDRLKYYGLPSSMDVGKLEDFEDRLNKAVAGGKPFSRGDMAEWAEFMGLNPKAEEQISYFSTWLAKQAIPVFSGYLTILKYAEIEYDDADDLNESDPRYPVLVGYHKELGKKLEASLPEKFNMSVMGFQAAMKSRQAKERGDTTPQKSAEESAKDISKEAVKASQDPDAKVDKRFEEANEDTSIFKGMSKFDVAKSFIFSPATTGTRMLTNWLFGNKGPYQKITEIRAIAYGKKEMFNSFEALEKKVLPKMNGNGADNVTSKRGGWFHSNGDVQHYMDCLGLDIDNPAHEEVFLMWYTERFLPIYQIYLDLLKAAGLDDSSVRDLDDKQGKAFADQLSKAYSSVIGKMPALIPSAEWIDTQYQKYKAEKQQEAAKGNGKGGSNGPTPVGEAAPKKYGVNDIVDIDVKRRSRTGTPDGEQTDTVGGPVGYSPKGNASAEELRERDKQQAAFVAQNKPVQQYAGTDMEKALIEISKHMKRAADNTEHLSDIKDGIDDGNKKPPAQVVVAPSSNDAVRETRPTLNTNRK